MHYSKSKRTKTLTMAEGQEQARREKRKPRIYIESNKNGQLFIPRLKRNYGQQNG